MCMVILADDNHPSNQSLKYVCKCLVDVWYGMTKVQVSLMDPGKTKRAAAGHKNEAR